jgi:hypothetical protein
LSSKPRDIVKGPDIRKGKKMSANSVFVAICTANEKRK